MTFTQMSPLSINLGGTVMIVGAITLPFYWMHFNLSFAGQWGYYATWACVAFFAYFLKRNRLNIDQSRREVTVQACWCLFFWTEETAYTFESIRYETRESVEGTWLRLICPDAARIDVYSTHAIRMLLDVLPDEPQLGHPTNSGK